MAGGGEGGGGENTSLESTPTWVVAIVCTVIVTISLVFERLLHYTGQKLKAKHHRRYLKEALEKVEGELMLLGFISLLLTVFQTKLSTICMPQHLATHWLPCKNEGSIVAHFQTTPRRRLLAEDETAVQCKPGKVPFLSLHAIHDLHTFIFILAVVTVVMNVVTVTLGSIKIHRWRSWETFIQKSLSTQRGSQETITNVQDNEFIRKHVYGGDNFILSWLVSHIKHIYQPVSMSDYAVMRSGFIKAHCEGNPQFDFHKFILRAYESDFTALVGVSWYLWIFMVIFLTLNIVGWHFYFWLSFLPLVVVLLVGTKLVHVINHLAKEVADRHSVFIGDLEIQPSDEHFWCNTPRFFLVLIHITLFQISFEIAIFFWIWMRFGFYSCQNGTLVYIIPRIVIVLFVEFVCSYSTLPLYAIVTQMGSSLNKAIFDEPVHGALRKWVERGKSKNTAHHDPSRPRSSVTFAHKMQKIATSSSRVDDDIQHPVSSSHGDNDIQPAHGIPEV